jgi:DNA-binding winged helix-turn-helix (wHTH) protein
MVLTRSGVLVSLPPKALNMLLALLESEGRVVTKQKLIESVWPDSFVEEGNLTQNIFLLRRELGDGYIQTIPKRGYRFAAAVEVSAQEDSPNVSAGNPPRTCRNPLLLFRATCRKTRRPSVENKAHTLSMSKGWSRRSGTNLHEDLRWRSFVLEVPIPSRPYHH